MPCGVKNISIMNRSFQEKITEYVDIQNFFEYYFQEAEICILSSHATAPAIDHLREMILELRRRSFNVAAVFFSNSFSVDAAEISLLDWDERLWVENELVSPDRVLPQIAKLAEEFSSLLIARAALH